MKHFLIALFCFLSLNLFAQTNPLDFSLDRLNAFSTLSITDTSELNKYREEYRNPNKQIDSLKGIILESYITNLFKQIEDSLLCSTNYDFDDLEYDGHFNPNEFYLTNYFDLDVGYNTFKKIKRFNELGYYSARVKQDIIGYKLDYASRINSNYYYELIGLSKSDYFNKYSKKNTYSKDKFLGINFIETWKIDSGRFLKNIDFAGVNLKSILADSGVSEIPFRMPLIKSKKNKIDGEISFSLKFIYSLNVNDSYFLEPQKFEEIYFNLIKGVKAGDVKVWFDGCLLNSYRQVRMLTSNYLLVSEEPGEHGVMMDTSLIPTKLKEIKGIVFDELWYFNPVDFSFRKQVKSLSILTGTFEEKEVNINNEMGLKFVFKD